VIARWSPERFRTTPRKLRPMTEPVPTGCQPIDDLLGGGFERGTVTQVYGEPAAGKTNLALAAAVEAAVDGGRAPRGRGGAGQERKRSVPEPLISGTIFCAP